MDSRTRGRIIACALVALAGGVAIAADGGDWGASPPPEGGPLLTAGFAESGPTAASRPPRAVVRGCASRISGGPSRRDRDTIVGPLRFNMRSYSPPRAWRRLVRDGQWMKSVARLRAGAQVTLVVPPGQRTWMRLAYAQRRGGVAAVTLRACRHRRSRAAQRRECVWAEGVAGPPGPARGDYTACRAGPTFFSGGFEIDYAEAPEQGRCAELIVWVKGEQDQHRVRLLHVEPGECAGDQA
jgi:hypothetical protein